MIKYSVLDMKIPRFQLKMVAEAPAPAKKKWENLIKDFKFSYL